MSASNYLRVLKHLLKMDRASDEEIIRNGGYEGSNMNANTLRRLNEVEGNRLMDSHIYEFDSDTTFLLTLTNNDVYREILHLPFPDIFLDCEFNMDWISYERIKVVGIQLGECKFLARNDAEFPGMIISVSGDCDDGLLAQLTARGFKIVPFDHINASVFFELPDGIRERKLPICRSINDYMEAVTEAGPGTHLLNIPEREADRLLKELRKMTYNFLDLLETKQIRIASIEHNNAKRESQGKLPMPPTNRILLNLPLKQYISRLKAGGHFHYSHAFWVAGHWRTFGSDWYKNKRGQKIWVYPYVKGKGIIIKKPHDVRELHKKPGGASAN